MPRRKQQRRLSPIAVEDEPMSDAQPEPPVLSLEVRKNLLQQAFERDKDGPAKARFRDIKTLLDSSDEAIMNATNSKLFKLKVIDANGNPLRIESSGEPPRPKRPAPLPPPEESDVESDGNDSNHTADSSAEGNSNSDESGDENPSTRNTTPSRGKSKTPPRRSAVMRSVEEPEPTDSRPDRDGEVALMKSPQAKQGLPETFRTEAFHRKLWQGRYIVAYGEKHAPLHYLQKQGTRTAQTQILGKADTPGEKKDKDGEWVYTADDIDGIYSIAIPRRINCTVQQDLERLKPEEGKRVILSYVRIGWRLKDENGKYIRDPETNEHEVVKCWERKGVLQARWGEGTNEVIYDIACMSVDRFWAGLGRRPPGGSMSPAPLRGQSAAPNNGSIFLRSSPVPNQDHGNAGFSVTGSPAGGSRNPAAQANLDDTQRLIERMNNDPGFMAHVSALWEAQRRPAATPLTPQHIPIAAY
ncbi:hypothetical protein PCL_08368 [Purpureocillium lilacinum]|uniref:Uncharacterized protein n=1 Tax=Purpureocillium lilacinum TaxID=33203 RepID=A0A2U3DRZ0_PURLI|nr:hypothetical protein PCL_08368 [Purpureocillium lilacinum]